MLRCCSNDLLRFLNFWESSRGWISRKGQTNKQTKKQKRSNLEGQVLHEGSHYGQGIQIFESSSVRTIRCQLIELRCITKSERRYYRRNKWTTCAIDLSKLDDLGWIFVHLWLVNQPTIEGLTELLNVSFTLQTWNYFHSLILSPWEKGDLRI